MLKIAIVLPRINSLHRATNLKTNTKRTTSRKCRWALRCRSWFCWRARQVGMAAWFLGSSRGMGISRRQLEGRLTLLRARNRLNPCPVICNHRMVGRIFWTLSHCILAWFTSSLLKHTIPAARETCCAFMKIRLICFNCHFCIFRSSFSLQIGQNNLRKTSRTFRGRRCWFLW